MTKGHGGAGGHCGGLGSWVLVRTQEDCFEQPVGVSTVTVLTVLLPNETRMKLTVAVMLALHGKSHM